MGVMKWPQVLHDQILTTVRLLGLLALEPVRLGLNPSSILTSYCVLGKLLTFHWNCSKSSNLIPLFPKHKGAPCFSVSYRWARGVISAGQWAMSRKDVCVTGSGSTWVLHVFSFPQSWPWTLRDGIEESQMREIPHPGPCVGVDREQQWAYNVCKK